MKKFQIIAIGCIPLTIFVPYLLFVFNHSSTSTLKDLGVFGDSFGVLNTLFTGLAFAALIINNLQQREEIRIQQDDLLESRKQFQRTADAQERTARLTAFSELLREYNDKITVLKEKVLEEESNRLSNKTTSNDISEMVKQLVPTETEILLKSQLADLISKRHTIIIDLEKSL